MGKKCLEKPMFINSYTAKNKSDEQKALWKTENEAERRN